jgi:DNA-binding GntR family transcriptional regulator
MRSVLEQAAGELAIQRIKPHHLDELGQIINKIKKNPRDDYSGYKKLDVQFHDAFHKAHGNQLLKEFLSKVQDRCIRLWNSIDENDDTIKALRRDSVLSLEKVYDALVAGDKQGVIYGLNHHFNSYLQTVISHLIGGFGMAEYLKEKTD